MPVKQTFRVLMVDNNSTAQGDYKIAVKNFGDVQVKFGASINDSIRLGIEFKPHYIMLGLLLPNYYIRRLLRMISDTPELSDTPVITINSELSSTLFH